MSTPSTRVNAVPGYLLAALAGLPALSYPFGRDQALYDYVGRGCLHGLLPYVDTFDHKPPLLYLVYALGALLPLPSQMGVRALEVATLLMMGPLIARLVEGERGSVPGWAVALALVNLHYTTFDWWQSAQSEVWEAAFLLGSAVVARRATGARGALIAGALSGVATGFKPTALLVALVIAAERAFTMESGQRARNILSFAAGGFAVGLLMLLPWTLAGELGTLWEVLFRYNRAHAESASGHNPTDLLVDHGPMALLMVALFFAGQAASLGAARRARARQGWWGLGLAGAAVLSVVAQDKYYPYHFSVILPFLYAMAVWGLAALADRLAEGRPRLAARRGALALTVALLWSALAIGLATRPRIGARPPWPDHVRNTIALARGRMSRDIFLAPYRSRHKSAYVALDVDRLARVIRGHQRPGDTLCARVYEPGFYTLTGMWCPSRFAVDFPLYDNDIQFPMRPAWRKEHEARLAEQPPTFMVTIDAKKVDRENLEGQGYTFVDERGRYVLYERRPG